MLKAFARGLNHVKENGGEMRLRGKGKQQQQQQQQ